MALPQSPENRRPTARSSQKVSFPGAGGDRLAARLDHPAGTEPGAARGLAMFAHCFTCSKDTHAASRIAAGLVEQGFAVLRFDFTGLGGSDGEFANTNFSSNVADLEAAAAWLGQTHRAPDLLIGHSLGGAAVLAAAGAMPSVKAIVTIGAPADPAHVAHLFDGQREMIEQDGAVEVAIAGRPFRVTRQFLHDIENQMVLGKVASLRRALLVIHAPRDAIVGIGHAGEIFAAARHPKSFLSLDDADHLLTRPQDAAYAAQVIAAWALRYLPEPAMDDAGEARPAGEVRVRSVAGTRFAQTIDAGQHRLRSDEPLSVGGDDSGPTPYDLLLAGLGACTSMTVRMYADRKEWPLQRVSIDLRHERIHAEDCAECESRDGKVDLIHRRIHIDGDLDEAQRERLLEIADRCPVHRTLTGAIRIETTADG
ncbi:MAG: alpha/beta fold hydrolase [Alphaproteobacteria bacterium]